MNMMAENIKSVELVAGEQYYVSSAGVAEYRGIVERTNNLDVSSLPQQYRNGLTPLHKFIPDTEYSFISRYVLVAEPDFSQGKRVHPLPELSEMKQIMRVVMQPPQAVDKRDEYKFSTTNVLGIAELLRDHKIHRDAIADKARTALATILAYHLKSLPAEAADYIDLMMKQTLQSWPEKLPHMPVSKEAMLSIVDRRKKKLSFDADYIETVNQVPVEARPSDASPPAGASAGASVISPFRVQAQPDVVPKLGQERAVSAHPVHKAPSIHPVGLDLHALFYRDARVYATLKKAFSGKPEMPVIEAAVGHLKVGEVVDLSKVLFASGELRLGNFVATKTKENPHAPVTWTARSARTYLRTVLSKLAGHLPEDGRNEGMTVINTLLRKFDHDGALIALSAPVEKSQLAEPVTEVVDQAAQQVLDQPSVNEPKSVAVVTTPLETASVDKGFIAGHFQIAIRRHPDDTDTTVNDRELELAVRHEDQLPIALTAARTLSTMAFDVFSRRHLRGQSFEVIAERVGTDTGTACRVFQQAAVAVKEELSHQIAKLNTELAIDCHNIELH